MTEIKLKPCPFCGGEAEIKEHSETTPFSEQVTDFFVICSECCCSFFKTIRNLYYQKNCKEIITKAKQELAEKWNRRTDNATD